MSWLTDLAKAMWGGLPILSRNVRPNLACGIGFLFGGIGLAIYFRTVIDLFIPIVVALVAQLIVWKAVGASVELGWLVGAIIAALYGFFRAQSSNQRREQIPPAPVPAASGT